MASHAKDDVTLRFPHRARAPLPAPSSVPTRTVVAVDVPNVNGNMKNPTFCSTECAARGTSPRFPAETQSIFGVFSFVFVPSLSWQNDRFSEKKIAARKKGERLFRTSHPSGYLPAPPLPHIACENTTICQFLPCVCFEPVLTNTLILLNREMFLETRKLRIVVVPHVNDKCTHHASGSELEDDAPA